MRQHGEMRRNPPTVKTAVGGAVVCDAGRRLSHPVRPGWARPCPDPGTCPLQVADDGREMLMMLCGRHMRDIERDGLAY